MRNEVMANLSTTFAALGEPTRFAIVERLLNEGELSAGEIQGVAAVSSPAISRHLKVLREAGVIQQRVERQRRMYSVRPESVQAIGSWTMSHREFWQSSLDRLDAILTKEAEK